MTVRAHFFRYFLILVLATSGLLSCNSISYTVDFETIYKGHSIEGISARAITTLGKMAIIGGAEGYISMRRLVEVEGQDQSNQRQFANVQDFRDAHCLSNGACMFMNSGDNGIIIGTAPAGNPFLVMDTAGVFLDGMAFWDDHNGIVYGDPIDGKFFLAKTADMGRSWNALTPQTLPEALENEGGFAASGTGIQTIGDSTVMFATGLGETARIFVSNDRGENWIAKETPMRSGGSFGIYSMYFWSESEGVIVGGSYEDSTYNEGICQYTSDGGDSWDKRDNGLMGYCSCVNGTADGNLLIATGRMGTFYSTSKGKEWKLLTNSAYYSCYITEENIILSGRNGILEIIKYTLSEL